MAKEAVSLHIYGMEQDKAPIPEPSEMKKLAAEEALEPKGRGLTFLILYRRQSNVS